MNISTSTSDVLETTKEILPIVKEKIEKEKELHPLYLEKINKNKEPVLPHQKNDIRPEEINEPAQEPPKEYINPETTTEAAVHLRTQNALKELKKEEARYQAIKEKHQKITQEINKLNKTVNALHTPSEKEIDINSKKFMDSFFKKLRLNLKIAHEKRSRKKQENIKKVYDHARKNGRITNDDVERLTGVKDTQARRYLNILLKRKKLQRHGSYNKTYYTAL